MAIPSNVSNDNNCGETRSLSRAGSGRFVETSPPKASKEGRTPLEERVRRHIEDNALLKNVRRIGLAVSGGSDSLSLLHIVAPICREKGIEPVVLNFDHAIPGEHSDIDAAFVRDEAMRLNLAFSGEVAD